MRTFKVYYLLFIYNLSFIIFYSKFIEITLVLGADILPSIWDLVGPKVWENLPLKSFKLKNGNVLKILLFLKHAFLWKVLKSILVSKVWAHNCGIRQGGCQVRGLLHHHQLLPARQDPQDERQDAGGEEAGPLQVGEWVKSCDFDCSTLSAVTLGEHVLQNIINRFDFSYKYSCDQFSIIWKLIKAK